MLSSDLLTDVEARAADTQLAALIGAVNLDRKLRANPAMAARFEGGLARALPSAYPREGPGIESAHRLLHRALYRVNRLGMFAYDDLGHYCNERSPYLMAVRDRIERAWQEWEARQLDVRALQRLLEAPLALRHVCGRISVRRRRLAAATSRRRRRVAGYCRVVQIAALEGLSEAALLARALAGPTNEVQAVLTRVLVERQRQSSLFTTMLGACGLATEPEAYFELVPWEALASLNHAFLLSGRRRHVLRYVGACLYPDTAAPAAFGAYRTAARRLGLAAGARGYWEAHIEHDERHGRWLLEGVALPLAAHYPTDAWELVLGYDQQKLIAERAAAAIARSARDGDQAATLRAAA